MLLLSQVLLVAAVLNAIQCPSGSPSPARSAPLGTAASAGGHAHGDVAGQVGLLALMLRPPAGNVAVYRAEPARAPPLTAPGARRDAASCTAPSLERAAGRLRYLLCMLCSASLASEPCRYL